MGYKGEDLDLRTPQLWSASSSDAIVPVPSEYPDVSKGAGPRSQGPSGGWTGPIWVDETVMACCNQAYDLAAAHRAAEVRLEHLLDAMTLVEAAARILEQRGILVTALRRDVGAMIATELPVASPSGKETPQRSVELESALRLAAERAYPRHTPVTTDELLRVLFDLNRELPAVQLLHHHVADWSPRELVDPRFGAPQGLRARMRVPAGSHNLSEPPADVEVARTEPSRRRIWPDDRLTTLERSIDMWLGELSRTGSVLADRVRSLEQALHVARSEFQIVPAAVSDKLQSLESRQRKLDEVERTLSLLLDRVAGYERYIKRRAPPEAADLASIGERLAALERMIASAPAVSVDLGAVEGRLKAIATHGEDTGRTLSGVADRLKSLEDVLGAQLPHEVSTLGSEIKALAGELGVQQAEGERRLEQFAERLQAAAAAIEGRGEALATMVATPVLERLARLGPEIKALAGELGAQQPQGERLLEQFTERLQALAAVIEREGEALATKVATPVVERLTGFGAEIKALAGEVVAQQAQGERLLEQFTERLQAGGAVIDREALAAEVATPIVERLAGLGSEIKALAGAMGSQQAQSERLLEPFTERLQALGAAIEGQAEALATNVVTPIMERLASLGSEHKVLAGAVGGQQAQVERLIEQFTQRLEGMAAFIEGQGEAHAAKVASPIVQRLAGLGDVVEKSQAGIGHTLGQFTERLAAVDQSLASCGQQTAELNAAHTRDVRDIREALLTVSGNQQTLASVVDQWRFDTTGDLSIISNRLQALERASLRPELIESLIATVQDLHRLLEEREEESGLRRWLRGTDDGNGAGQGLRAGIKKLAKPSPGSVGSEPSPDGRKSWLRQATEFVRRRRPK